MIYQTEVAADVPSATQWKQLHRLFGKSDHTGVASSDKHHTIYRHYNFDSHRAFVVAAQKILGAKKSPSIYTRVFNK